MQHTGHSSPLGAVIVDGGVIFSLFSRSATGVVVDVHTYDWEGDTPLHLPSSRTTVYDSERVLGAAGLRATSGGSGGWQTVAPLD